MLSRKLHLEQINRFHDTLEYIDKKIEEEKDKNVQAELSFLYFKLTRKLWPKIDDFTEQLKDEIDSAYQETYKK